jgi:hypothetical protein
LLVVHVGARVKAGAARDRAPRACGLDPTASVDRDRVEAPRGTEFLFNPNRFNVGVGRARVSRSCFTVPSFLEGAWSRIDDPRRLNLCAHAEAVALQPT